MMMLRDNTGTDDTGTTPPTPKTNINWLSRWLSDTEHDTPLKCVWCEQCFLDDYEIQAEVRAQMLITRNSSSMSVQRIVIERYMKWHINGHPENEST